MTRRDRIIGPGGTRAEEPITVGTDDKTVVVTGLGATTPLGGDVASTWAGMLAGNSGVRALTEDWVKDLPARIAGVAGVDPAQIVGRVRARRMDRCEQFGVVAAREAWADAGSPEVDPERLGVSVTSGIGGLGSILAGYDTLKGEGRARLSPYTVPMLMPNGSAGWISMEFGARAGAPPLVSACRACARGGRHRPHISRFRHRHAPFGAGRRGGGGRHRGGDHGAEHRGLRGDAGHVHA